MRIFVLFLLTFMASAIQAGTFRLSLDQAVDQALKHHEGMQVAQSDKEIAAAKSFSAYSNLAPTVSADYQKVHFDMRGALSSTEKYMPVGWAESATVTARQTVFAAGKVVRGVKMANLGSEISSLNYRSTQEDLTLGTKVLYYTALHAKKAYDISRESYQNAIKNQKELLNRMRFGRASQADQLKMRADIAQREPTLKQAETTYLNALEDLKEHLRIAREDNLELVDSFDSLTLPFLTKVEVEKATKNRAELQVIEKGIEVAKLQESNSKAAFSPDVAAFVQYAPSRYSREMLPEDGAWKNTVNMGVGVSFSFGGAKIGAVKEAVASRYKNEYALRLKTSSFQNELQNKVVTFNSLLDVYAAAQKSYQLAIESYRLTEQLFKSGSISQTYLNDRELQLTQAKQAKAQVLFNLFAVHAQIENLTSEGVKNVQ